MINVIMIILINFQLHAKTMYMAVFFESNIYTIISHSNILIFLCISIFLINLQYFILVYITTDILNGVIANNEQQILNIFITLREQITKQKHNLSQIITQIVQMNITSSVPNSINSTVSNLHKMYVLGKEQSSEINPHHKFKSKIRIKSKSQGKFLPDHQKQTKPVSLYKTLNLMSIVKQAKSSQIVNKFHEEKINSVIIPEDFKNNSQQREILFLKQLVNRRKQPPLGNYKETSISRSQSQLNLSKTMKEKSQTPLPQRSQSKLFSGGYTKDNNREWDKKIDEYQYYDSMVKDLLSEMSTRKSSVNFKTNRPMISPSKYSEAKQKLLAKIQAQQSQPPISLESNFCNFKSLIKIQPKKDSMIFRMNDYVADSVYQRKITSYIKFLYKVNFSNSIYIDLALSNPGKVYKVKIGPGNNSELIKMLIKRRFWLQIDNSLQVSQNNEENTKICFIWTQSSLEGVFNIQKNNENGENHQKKTEQIEKISRKLRKLKLPDKKRQSFIHNQKILNVLQIQETESHYLASSFGNYSVHSKIQPEIVSNHIPCNYVIGSKKSLFLLLHWYYENIIKIDPFTYLPKTYHIRSGQVNNPLFLNFLKNEGDKPDRVWIVKPGENTNRGNGINVASFSQVNKLIRRKEVHRNGQQKTYIIQKYLRPFLYNGRKFDIRHYLLITSVKGNIKAYWYKEGYIRTSSEKYDIQDLGNEFIHLTNDAIQKKSELYGKYEPGNKLSYSQFQRYLDQNHPQKKYSFETQILKKMKEITTDLIHASFSFLDPERKNHNFEIYGMDFMINNKFQPYLIEVNANPCLQISCPVLQRIIPTLVQHTFRLALDPLFPPPEHYPINCRYQLSDRILQKLKFQLIFDEKADGSIIRQKISQSENKFTLSNKNEADEQIFQNDGQNCQVFQID